MNERIARVLEESAGYIGLSRMSKEPFRTMMMNKANDVLMKLTDEERMAATETVREVLNSCEPQVMKR